MISDLDSFNKKKDFLICIDSDGCAIDTMDIKHTKCFGPCMVDEWNLYKWRDPILYRWNEVNLYNLTRGINRFKGLALALKEIDEKYIKIDGLDRFTRWTCETFELSNESLEAEIEKEGNSCLEKALKWSEAVNRLVDSLKHSDKAPFKGVVEAVNLAKKYADIAVVSSANERAVLDEWGRHGILNSVDIVLTQNFGSKTYCIDKLVSKGYSRYNVLMVGDALGDLKAAKDNGVLYYPIIAREEEKSWDRFSKEALDKFIRGCYAGDYEEKIVSRFKENLSR